MKETYAGTRRTEPRGCRFMNLYSVAKKWSFELKRACYVHDATKAFFKFAHQCVVRGCHFSGPLYEPFRTTSRDP